jgi:hypothetical protein
LIIGAVAVFIAYETGINYNVDLTLISIAMIFPLVFTIRGSFRRREKALEHLSQFRSSLKTIHYYFLGNNKFSITEKNEIFKILENINDTFLEHLGKHDYETSHLDLAVYQINDFMEQNNDLINDRLKSKVFSFLADVHESMENLNAIHCHRTPISLRAYCKIFIYVFPFFYAPIVINNVGYENSVLISYFVVLVTEFILISLYNIQDKLEHPFDNDGLDDINLDIFKISKETKSN